MRLNLPSTIFGFALGYLVMTEDGRRLANKVSNVGGGLVEKFADSMTGLPVSTVMSGINNVLSKKEEKVNDDGDKRVNG